MSECAAGGEHEFDIIEEDQRDGEYQMTCPTGCSKCNKVWDYWQYEWYGWKFADIGNPDCEHEWHTTDASDTDGPDGAPRWIEECGRCPAVRRADWVLTETYHGDAEGNRV